MNVFSFKASHSILKGHILVRSLGMESMTVSKAGLKPGYKTGSFPNPRKQVYLITATSMSVDFHSFI